MKGRGGKPPALPKTIISRNKKMCKKKIRNSALYLLFALNCVNAAKHGASLIFWISAALVAAVAVFDISEALRK